MTGELTELYVGRVKQAGDMICPEFRLVVGDR